MSLESINICVWGLDLDVDFYYHKGYAGTLEQPPEPECIELDNIAFIRSSEHEDMLEELGMTEEELQQNEVFLAAVESEIWETAEYNKANDYDESQDDSYLYDTDDIDW